nr:nucleotide pyrophosphatase/phosphodiesterase family protein [Kineosphaera limosa]
MPLEPSRSAVVVLVDGLGAQLLARRGGHAPFLRSLLTSSRTLTSGFPSTTATSMGTFGTGLPPGAHGLVGYEVLDPGSGRVFNELSWKDGPDPRAWQPAPTVFERAEVAGVAVTMIGPGYFDGSGLTTAALRGARFRAGRQLAERVDQTLAALQATERADQPSRALVYLYWGELDKVGHVHGCDSWQWGDELESLDRELAGLARRLPRETSLYVTADHGMVDVPFEHRLDVAHEPDLDAGVRLVGGEPRAVQLYCETGAVADVLAAWRARLGDDAWVVPREEAESTGWFGAVSPTVRPRIGDVIAAMRGSVAVVDSRIHRPEVLSLLGVHGSLTADEVQIPLLMHRA